MAATPAQLRSMIFRTGLLPGFQLPPDCLPLDQCATKDVMDELLALGAMDWDGHGFSLTESGNGMRQRLVAGQPVPEIGL